MSIKIHIDRWHFQMVTAIVLPWLYPRLWRGSSFLLSTKWSMPLTVVQIIAMVKIITIRNIEHELRITFRFNILVISIFKYVYESGHFFFELGANEQTAYLMISVHRCTFAFASEENLQLRLRCVAWL